MADLRQVLDALHALAKQVAEDRRERSAQARALFEAQHSALVRSNDHAIVHLDTNVAPMTNKDGQKVDLAHEFGGEPASALTVWDVGGGTLQLRLNGKGPWLSVRQGDVFEHLFLWHVEARVTTGAAGTAVLLATAYVPHGGR